jgi:hypothetical protein
MKKRGVLERIVTWWTEPQRNLARPLSFTLEQGITSVIQRIQGEFNTWRLRIGAIGGIAPLNSNAVVPDAHLPRYVRRTVQLASTLPINFAAGLYVNYDMTSTPINAQASHFQNPVVGDSHIIILRNSTAGNKTFNLPPTGQGHKSNTYSITVNTNQRRRLVGYFDGTVWDWQVDAAKTL